ncbi:MAG: hypothetical protein AAF603_01930 [Pseudomonadota bacterium]
MAFSLLSLKRSMGFLRRYAHDVGQDRHVRRAAPWAITLTLHAVIAWGIMVLDIGRPPKGLPDQPQVVSVYVVPTLPPLVSPTPKPPQNEPPQNIEEETVQEALGIEVPPQQIVSPTAEIEEQAVPPLEISPQSGGIALPEVALPRTAPGEGTPDGIVALNCYDQFKDPDKAAECAGREILSGWRAEAANIGEDWARIAEDLRRGGVGRPAYGPDELGQLAPGEEIYRPAPSFLDRRDFERPSRYSRAFPTRAEEQRYRQLYEPRSYIPMNNPAMADHGTRPSEPLSGWRPSWMLREDPTLDQRAIREILDQVEGEDVP